MCYTGDDYIYVLHCSSHNQQASIEIECYLISKARQRVVLACFKKVIRNIIRLLSLPLALAISKLHAIMPQIDEKYYSGCTNRKDEVIISRLRIGHTRLTHSFRMENRPHPPLCDQCEGDHELTVKHILIECNFLKIIRRRHYDVTDLNQLFKTVPSKRILDFVKDIGLYNSL